MKKISDYNKGMLTAEALLYSMSKKYPNDTDLGKVTRKFLTEKIKTNPLKVEIETLVAQVEFDYKHNDYKFK